MNKSVPKKGSWFIYIIIQMFHFYYKIYYINKTVKLEQNYKKYPQKTNKLYYYKKLGVKICV